jgi:hypothetical protein
MVAALPVFLAVAYLSSPPGRAGTAGAAPAEPVTEGRWLRPATTRPAEPVWGVKGGVAVGLWPTSGPRGLIRVYAPYLGQRRPRMITFISIEPVARGVRAQSEMDAGPGDRKPGIAFWTGETREQVAVRQPAESPARGTVTRSGAAEVLTFWLATEPFRNGARPLLEVILCSDRPYEVGFRLHAGRGSERMDSCVLSATMGNYARLRRLWLRGEVVEAGKLWPEFRPDKLGFAPWRAWGRERLLQQGGELVAAATGDEADPARAAYSPDVSPNWRYTGRSATQYWRTADVPGAVVRVNGRTTYWGNGGKIPGGVAYENFEMEAPFAEGQEFWFGVTPERPAALGFDPAWEADLTDGRGQAFGRGLEGDDTELTQPAWPHLLVLAVSFLVVASVGAVLWRVWRRRRGA